MACAIMSLRDSVKRCEVRQAFAVIIGPLIGSHSYKCSTHDLVVFNAQLWSDG